jgi:beta-lactamase regulating signal transducer with metallopeptidase domain
MNAFSWWLAENAIATAFLCAVAWIACRLLWKRPAVQHALWLIVLAKFVMPPVFAWPWSERDITSAWSSQNHQFDFADDDESHHAVRVEYSPGAFLQQMPTSKSHVVTAENVIRGLLGAWCVGCATALLIQVRRIRKYRAILGQSKPAPQYLTAENNALSRAMELSPICVRIVDGISTPFVWCFGSLQLMWPASLSHDSDMRRSRSLLAHELAHVRRRDHWIVWLELVAGAIWWWSPVYWFVRRRLRESAEMACDAMALSVLPHDRRAYAEMFLELSSSFKPGELIPALGISSGTVSSFERRLSMILSDCVSGKLSKSGLLLAGLFAFSAFPSWSLGQSNDGQVLFSVIDNRSGQCVFAVGKNPHGDIVIERVGSDSTHDERLESALKRYAAEAHEAASKHIDEKEALAKHRAEEATLMEHRAKEAALMERQAKEAARSNGTVIEYSTRGSATSNPAEVQEAALKGVAAEEREVALERKLQAEAEASASAHRRESASATLREMEESEQRLTSELASLRERMQKLKESGKAAE